MSTHTYVLWKNKKNICLIPRSTFYYRLIHGEDFVCVEVLWPSQLIRVMSSPVS